jgi:hypothetical protein
MGTPDSAMLAIPMATGLRPAPAAATHSAMAEFTAASNSAGLW